jgi:preprotein translocase subunit SecG
MTDMLALSFLQNLTVVLFILLCVALILIILLQKGKGGGLGSAFGGGGAGSLLGTKTGDFLTWVTISLVAAFLILAVLMGKFMRPKGASSTLSAPATTAAKEVEGTDTEAVEGAEANMDQVAEEAANPVVGEKAAANEEPAERTSESATETATK